MELWRTTAEGWILGEMGAGHATAPSLVGRGEDLDALDAALEQARGGEPVTVLVAGEAGIGKTRLVEEFSARAFAQGARLLAGSCVDLDEAALPYGAIMDALRAAPIEAYDRLAPPLRRELAALVPEAAPDDDPRPHSQTTLFGAVLRLVEQLGREAPLVLLIDDLHWADRSTQELVRFLVRGLRQTAALIVLTYRSDELARDHPVRRLLTELARAPRVQARTLAPLTRAETGRQLDALAGEPVDAATIDAIHARSEGNPFFSEELLAARTAGREGVPDSLRDALLDRIDRLPAAAQGVARAAAAAGREIDHELLAAIAGLSADALDDALRACVTGHVLTVEGAGGGYRFRHALLHEAAAGELLPGERRRLHERLAELLESRPAGTGSAEARRLAEIAHHRLRADEPGAALAAAVRAARAAEAVHAVAEAARYYDAALELWETVADPQARAGVDLAFLLERAADCRWLGQGDLSFSTRMLERAIAELDEANAPLRRAGFLSRLATTNCYVDLAASLPAHEQALALLDGTPSEIAARVRGRYAATLMLLGEYARSEPEALEAMRVARAAGSRVEEADALITLFVCRASRGDRAAALELVDDVRPLVAETGNPRLIQRLYTNMPHILYSFAMYEESVAAAREGIAVHVRAGLNRYGQIGVHENGIGALCALGRPAEAVEMLGDEPEAISPDVGIWLHVRHAQLGAMLGDLDAAAARFVRCRAVPGLNAMVLAPICALQAETALWREDVETALEAVVSGEAKLVEDERLDAAPLLCTAVRVQAAAAAAGVVAPDAARAEADRLIARLRRVVSKGTAPLPEPDQRLVHALAERSRLEPSPDPAAWAAATAGWTALRRPYEAAYSGWRWAEALASARGPRDEVEHVLRNAHAAAVGVGTPHLVAAITGLARRARIALPGLEHDEHAPFGDLTARERDVLALVADGRTNRQIAEELFITDKTASVHVSNILAKLGAANRGEAAALAHRAGFDNEPSLQG